MDRPGGGPSSKRKKNRTKIYMWTVSVAGQSPRPSAVWFYSFCLFVPCVVWKALTTVGHLGHRLATFGGCLSICVYLLPPPPARDPETFYFFPEQFDSHQKRKKTSCDWLWFQCHSLDVLDVKLFLIGTHLMNWWWWVDRRREGLYIQQLIGLLFSDTKWSGWMELFVSSLTKWFLLYLGYICLAL
jgi:hypothetical protein